MNCVQNSCNIDRVERSICGFITYHFVMSGVLWLFSGVPALNTFSTIVSLLNWAIYFGWLIKLYPGLKARSYNTINHSYIIFFALYVIAIAISAIRDNPIDIMLKHDALWTFVYFLPIGLTAFSVRNYTALYEMLYKYSFIITVCCSIIFIIHILNPFKSYDMTFGYTLLVPTLFHYSYYFSRSKKLWILLVAIFETLMLLLYGSRGVFIAIAVFFVIRFYFINQKKINKGVIVLVVGLVGIFFIHSGPKLLNDYLESKDIYSRTLMAFIDPDYEQTGDRNEWWAAGVDLIKKNPIIGYGLGGYYYDFHYQIIKNDPSKQYVFDPIEREYYKAVPTYGGCHSGFLELSLFFGVLIGIVIAFRLLFSIFKVKKKTNRDLIELFLIFYSIYIIPNMIVSSGFHYKPGCAIYIFLFLSYIKNLKKDKNEFLDKNVSPSVQA